MSRSVRHVPPEKIKWKLPSHLIGYGVALLIYVYPYDGRMVFAALSLLVIGIIMEALVRKYD